MTFGEMSNWTKRLNQIKGAAQCLKDKRLRALKNDFVQAYKDSPGNLHVAFMLVAISEEIEGVK